MMKCLPLKFPSVNLVHPNIYSGSGDFSPAVQKGSIRGSIRGLSCCPKSISAPFIKSIYFMASAYLGVSALRVLKNYSISHTFGSSMTKKFPDDSKGKIDSCPNPLASNQISVDHNLGSVNNLACEPIGYSGMSCHYFILVLKKKFNVIFHFHRVCGAVSFES